MRSSESRRDDESPCLVNIAPLAALNDGKQFGRITTLPVSAPADAQENKTD